MTIIYYYALSLFLAWKLYLRKHKKKKKNVIQAWWNNITWKNESIWPKNPNKLRFHRVMLAALAFRVQ